MNGSLGHFKGIIDRRKQHLEKKNGKFERNSKLYRLKTNNLEFQNLSEPELIQLKKSIREKIQSRKRKELIFLIFVILTLLIVFYYSI